ncbi:MAG: hypothetical protein AAFX92_17695 [Pseudomonadota bacterium]
MTLPGGIMRDGQRLRDYRFKTLTGGDELAIAEAFAADDGVPRRITAVLTAALDTLGGTPATIDDVRALAVGDRQFLMQQLVALLDAETGWMTADCQHCGEPFDFAMRFGDLPCKSAGEGFPFSSVNGATYRAPTGADQEALADVGGDGSAAQRSLVALCRVDGAMPVDVGHLDEADLARIDAALEAVSPEAVTETSLDCPSCGRTCTVDLGIDAMPLPRPDTLYQEVHRIASIYHWSEGEILALPRQRRQRYLALIARDAVPSSMVRQSA